MDQVVVSGAVRWGGRVKWQKCVEDNAGVIVDELKLGGAGSEQQTRVPNVRKIDR